MTTAGRYERAMSPFDLAGVKVRNRLFLPAHTTNFGRDFLPTEEHVAYLRERARAGVGLVIVEPLRVHRTSLGRAGGLSGSDRRAIDGLRRIVDVVRGEGARIFVQVTHAGRHGENVVDRLPAWGPSAIPWMTGGELPHAMTRAEMDEVREAYVETAELALEAGFEGIEIHLGHGHLLHQFLSPAANAREDEWGGSAENRLRYPLEVLGRVVGAMSGRMPVGIRVSVDDLMPGALGPDEQRDIIRRSVAEIPGIGFVNASVAAYQWPSIGHHVADMAHPPHPFRDLTEALRPVIGDLPLLTANRYRTLAEAEATIARGRIDMVGLNRAQMADPELIIKSLAGREQEVRPCVAHNFCIGQIGASRPISCMMNPRVGREREWPETPHRTGSPRRVLVLGGGPAGMEAARISALAGHEVTLWEAGRALGGLLAISGTGHGRADLHLMRDWLTGTIERADVDVVLGRRADLTGILAFAPDELILATGAARSVASLPGTDLDDVVAALEAPRTGWAGKRIAIWDETGSWATLSAAETLAQAGAQVEIVARSTTALWGVTLYSRMTALERLAATGVKMRLGHAAVGVEAGMLRCLVQATGDTVLLGPFDGIVHSGPGTAATALQTELQQAGLAVMAVGDAVAPRTLFEAMNDAQVAARAIGVRR